MATSNGQRVGAFLLALLFFLTTVGTAGYVIWQINQEDGVIVQDPASQNSQQASEEPTQDSPSTLANYSGPVEIPELRFEDEVVGDGETVAEGATITIHYTGALASDGTVFDSSIGGEPATFPLDNLIAGWKEGIPGMKVGGKRRLFIPADLGYGATGSGSSVPPNSDLIFDIELFATE